ncbi:phosphate regulon sensor histidine kinase PhoR [Congregibacter brevis]|uniref:Phosphate regulon sensor protein PhoR n=1 Tax=Congregibacter brevis TaxID=3081201 RepID=A0ABZ0IDB0_9GAMM|nr:phosphate regulon sensor histidine kinase PhoR [Congregibacter sp. IMCC45268]
MSLAGSWRAELRKLLLVLVASGVLGWLTGYTLEMLCIGLAILSGIWLWQLWLMRRWLEDPDQAPPESAGIWGLVYDTIYGLQRENREARGRLQSTVDYLRSSFASMRDGVLILTQSGAIEWSNDAAEGLLGLQYPRDQGQPVLNLLRWPAFHDYFLKGEFQQPLQIPNSGNSRQILQVEITTFAGGDFLLFFRDVTRVVQMEQMRRDFVGNVSHELRTPLTVFKGYLDTLSASELFEDARFQKAAGQMDMQVQRMENLLTDLLWLSRIETVSEDRETGEVNMVAMLEELREELRSSHPERLVVLEMKTTELVTGNYRELRSAVSNLVINALKYSGDDDPVRVSWEREGEALVLNVVDSGVGIDEQHIARVTERFYRVDESRNARTGGTGLGLAIVKHVAASHRAELNITSEPGRGSCFSLHFPL